MATQRSTQSESRSLPWTEGSVLGALAFAAGYGVLYLVKSSAINDYISSSAGMLSSYGIGGTPPTWKFAGWLYYTAHNLELEIAASAAGQSQTTTQSMQSNPVWDGWLLALPAIALIAAGAYVTYSRHIRDSETAAKYGVTVIPGYFAAVVAGAFVFAWTIQVSGGGVTGELSMKPPLTNAALIAGVIYPVVFGGIGGIVGSKLGNG
jgi:hypothetical protein